MVAMIDKSFKLMEVAKLVLISKLLTIAKKLALKNCVKLKKLSYQMVPAVNANTIWYLLAKTS